MAPPLFPAWLLAAALALVTIGLFRPATGYDFINYDDPEFVSANPQVQAGISWAGVKWALGNTTQAFYWAPLTWLSHMLVCQFLGPNPWGPHLINALLHATNTALVFLVLRRLTGATWPSVVVAALFGWHPLRVESVAWVTERKDVLSALFWLLALSAYARYAEVQSLKSKVQSPAAEGGTQKADPPGAFQAGCATLHAPRFYLVSLLCFALGLMSKPMLVTLPCVLLLLDYWPLRRFRRCSVRRLVMDKIPFFALAAAASGVTYLVQRRGGVLAEAENLPLGARGANALISYCRYLGKLLRPTDLAVFYPRPEHWSGAAVLLAGALLLAISGLLWAQRRRQPFLLMGWLWFLGTLVPVIGLVQSGDQAMADRFSYVPSLGVLILAVWGACELTRGWCRQARVVSLAASVAMILCLALTRLQLGYWQDSEVLFRHALGVTERNYIAHYGLGAALAKEGHLHEAIRQYEESLRLKPDFADAHFNLARLLAHDGQLDPAIRHYRESLRWKPNSADAHYNLGNALGRQGQVDQAIGQYQAAVRLKPDFALAYNNLGNAWLRKGHTEQAIGQFQEAIRLEPGYALAHNNLGNAFYRTGHDDQAIRQFEEAIRLKPDYADAHNGLGLALCREGRKEAAARQFQEALKLEPDHAGARTNLNSLTTSAAGLPRQPPPVAPKP